MYYKHDLNYEYPQKSDQHMLTVKHVREINFDENYPYIPKGIGYQLLRSLYWLALNLIVFPLLRLTHGLRIYGKKNLKKHKTVLKNGAITISNHVFMWDFLCVLKAIRPRLVLFPAWKENLQGSLRGFVRLSGGIPIPTGNRRAMCCFHRAICEVLESDKWLHFFPEGSMWFYYPDIRPLKKAVFQYAVQYNKPVLPITLSFRPRRGLMRLFGKKPLVDLHVGEPLLPDATLSRAEAVKKMHAEAYRVMQVMNGITKDHPSYVADPCPREYQKTM